MEALAIRKNLLGLLDKDCNAFYRRLFADPVFFFDSCLWTYDPRSDRGALPFVLWPYQRKWVRWSFSCILDGKDFLTDKSRDMGVTWMILGITLYCWLVFDNFSSLLGSRKEEYVDKKGDKKTHFERLRFMIKKLPTPVYHRLLVDHGFSIYKHSAHMKLINPANDNEIVGEATNDDFSRQARATFIFLDEFAMVENNMQKKVWTATADTTPCRGVVSTPKGRGNWFANLRHNGGLRFRSLRWTCHPHKRKGLCYVDDEGVRHDAEHLTDDQTATGYYQGHKLKSPWWETEDLRRRANPSDMAQEVEIGYLASGDPVFNPTWTKKHLANAIPPRYRLQPVVTWGDDGKPDVRWEDWGEDGEFFLWGGRPRGKSIYCIGVDVSEGLSDQDSDPDYHAIVVLDVIHRHVVATFRSRNLDPRDLAAVVNDLTIRWKAFLTVERNGPGVAVMNVLSGLITGYDLDAEVFRPRRFQDRNQRVSRDSGFKTTAESKPHLIELIRHWTDPASCHLRDERLIHEYMVYSKLPGFKMGAPSGCHDDMVMGLSMTLVAAQDAILAVPHETPEESGFDHMVRLQQRAFNGEDVRDELKRLIG